MKRVFILVALFSIGTFPAAAQRPEKTTSPVSAHEQLNRHTTDVLNIRGDFLWARNTAEGGPDGPDGSTARELANQAMHVFDAIDAANSVLWMYNEISCPSDRDKMRGFVATTLVYQSERLKPAIDAVDRSLANPVGPGLAEGASHLKDEIRECRALLDGVDLR